MPSGGKRTNAGRKSSGVQSEHVSLRISTRAREWIRTETERRDVTVAELIDELIFKHS